MYSRVHQEMKKFVVFFLCFLTIVKERAGVNKKSFWEVYGGGVTHRRDVCHYKTLSSTLNINNILKEKISDLEVLSNYTNNVIEFNDTFENEIKDDKKREVEKDLKAAKLL